jgi:hypothetical protein
MDEPLEIRAAPLAHALNLACVLGAFAAAISGHASQPAVVPSHFDLSGAPDGWVAKSWGNTLAVPLVGLCLTALLYASAQLAGWVRKHPELLNMPDKQAFLALPPEAQAPIWRGMKAMIYWLAVPQSLLFLALVALGPTEDGRLRVWPIWLLTGVLTVLPVVLGIRWVRSARRAVAAVARPRRA